MFGREAQAAADVGRRTRRGAGADAEGAAPLLRTVAACAPRRVPEEGLAGLGGRSVLAGTRLLRRRSRDPPAAVSERADFGIWLFLRQGLAV